MSEHDQEVEPTPLEPTGFERESTESDTSTATDASGEINSVEFSTEDANPDYAKGLFMRNARHLQEVFVELYKQDPTARYSLTLERL